MADNTWAVLITAGATVTGVWTGSALTALAQRRHWLREEGTRKRQVRRDRPAEFLAVALELTRLFPDEAGTASPQVRELGRLAAYSRLHDHREVYPTVAEVHARALAVQSAIATGDRATASLIEDYEASVTAFLECVSRYARE